jgi:hypothetical protein
MSWPYYHDKINDGKLLEICHVLAFSGVNEEECNASSHVWGKHWSARI